MKIEPSPGSRPVVPIQHKTPPLTALPDHLGPPSTTPPSASEVFGHLLNLPHDVPKEALETALRITFISAIGSHTLPDKG